MGLIDPEFLDPAIHSFARCPYCDRLNKVQFSEGGDMDLQYRECMGCGIKIGGTVLMRSFADTTLHTAAITSANKISSFNLAVLPFIGAQVIIMGVGLPALLGLGNLLIYSLPIYLAIQWNRKYGMRKWNDAEFLEALRKVKVTATIFTIAVLCVAAMITFSSI